MALNGVSPSCACVTMKLPVTIICSSLALTVAGNSRILVCPLTVTSDLIRISGSSPDQYWERISILLKLALSSSLPPSMFFCVPCLFLSETVLLNGSPS